MSDGSQVNVKPEVEFLGDLFSQITAGKLRVPRFQRSFVWRPEQMRALFDSIERGYPVGTLLLWDTAEPVRSLDRMGAITLPPRPDGTVSYVLDGHQRLSTLYSVLNLPADAPRDPDDEETWKWWIYRDLTEGDSGASSRFTHMRRGDPPPTYLPLRTLLRTTDFLGFARTLKDDQLVDRAEEIATRIKSYKLGLIRVIGADLAQAVEIFSRLNSEGQKMQPDEMVAALTYREDLQGGFSLAERIDDILVQLEELDFGELPREEVVFRTILAATGQADIQRTNWPRLARDIGEGVPGQIEAAQQALAATISFMRGPLGVPHVRLVPYAAQMVQLAGFFLICPDPDESRASALERWFRSTSLSGWFGGANTTQLKKMLASMRAFARGEISAEELLAIDEPALPYPAKFDMQSARVRTLLLNQIALRRPLGADGKPIEVGRELMAHGNRAWRHVLPSQLRNSGLQSDPANRILLPPEANKSVRQTIVDLDPNDPVGESVLNSHFISKTAHQWLVEGDYEGFVRDRALQIAGEERRFIESLGTRGSP